MAQKDPSILQNPKQVFQSSCKSIHLFFFLHYYEKWSEICGYLY